MELDIDKIAELVAKHGFPIVSAIGMAWFVYYVWTWATTDIKPIITQANVSVIDLLDRIRRLDLDICRVHEKVDVAVQLRQKYQYYNPKSCHCMCKRGCKYNNGSPSEDAINSNEQ